MKAKLIKKGKNHYDLRLDDGGLYTSTYQWTSNGNLLSFKNCEAIENGYDLDELAEDRFGNSSHHTNNRCSYKEGFQKALELMKHRLVEETEWQVEVLMDICGDKVYAVPEPVLDEQGCLILKRIDN